MNLLNRPPLGLKAEKPPKDPEHLERIRGLPCVICHEWDMTQLSPTAAHHCIHGRYSQAKSPDSMAIPLCEGHHQGLRDTSKVAIHKQSTTWRKEYGADTDWISWTEQMLGEGQ